MPPAWLERLHATLPGWSEAAIAVVAALATWLAITVALRVALARARALAARTDNQVDDAMVEVLAGTSQLLIVVASVLVGIGLLDLSDRWHGRVAQLWFAAFALQAGLWGHRATTVGLQAYERRHASPGAPQVSATTTLLSWALRTVVWAIVLLAILSNLGVNITAFVASLGVGGIAVALAVQNILGDLFASASIAVDKPFEVGDFIVVGSTSGTVENVGLKTTRIRALGGEQIVVSNTDLLKQTIANFKRLQTRRIAFRFGVMLDTPPEALAALPARVRESFAGHERLTFQRAHFAAIGAESYEFEVVYLVNSPEYDVYMDEQQAINLAILDALRKLGVQVATPTRQLRLLRPQRPRPGGPASAV